MKNKHIHFVGIKGVGMAALAIYCKQRGFKVTGSDTKEQFHTDNFLKKYKIPIFLFNKTNINSEIDLVIYSGAYDLLKNVETAKALKLNIPLQSHGEALGEFMKGKSGISVAGTHGKTTTTSLIAAILLEAKKDPSFVIGAAAIDPLGAPGHYGKGDYFVAEADEYQTAVNNSRKARFLWQSPDILVMTNIDFDHPDVYKDINEVKNAFRQLVLKIPKKGVVVYNGNDKNSKEVVFLTRSKKINFANLNLNIKSKLIGRHNELNVKAAIAVTDFIGINRNFAFKALTKFTGAKRRLELIKESSGILYFDDYAHHPREVSETLTAVKNHFPKKRLIVIFQPHTYTRTQALFKEFMLAFKKADIVIINEIFASAREIKGKLSINGEKFVQELKKNHNHVVYAKNQEQMIQYLKTITKPNDLVLTMGAGDIYKIHDFI